MLKDGSDSVGALGALNRVYLNIGLFSEEWLLHFNPVVGGKPITPIPIAIAEKNSSYWQATEAATPHMALFFLQAARPDRLKDAPGGAKYLTADAAALDRGKTVFAETCARCHSSKAPKPAVGLDPVRLRRAQLSAVLEQLLGVDEDRRLQAADARDRQRAGFPRRQLPVDRSARAGDAAADQRLQPAGHQCARRQHLGQFLVAVLQDAAVGRHDHGARSVHRQAVAVQDAGGRTRLHAAAVADQPVVDRAVPAQQHRGRGSFEQDPSVDARMRVFQASIEQMLWPEKRRQDALFGDKTPGDPVMSSTAPPTRS